MIDADNAVNPKTWKRAQNLMLAAGILVYLLIVAGGIVSATRSGGSCPDWPTCLGSWTPPAEPGAFIDYAHRFTTILALPTLLGAAILARKTFRQNKGLSQPLFVALGLFAIQIGLGAWMTLAPDFDGREALNSLHLGLSLLTLAGILFSAVGSFYPEKTRLTYHSPFARLSLALLGTTFALLVSGALLKSSGAGGACAFWPLCGGSLIPTDAAGWMNGLHRGLTALAGLLMGMLLLWLEMKSIAVTILALSALLSVQIGLSGYNTVAQERSAKHIAEAIRSEVTAGVPFYSVMTYEQTLPFYLQRTFTLVQYQDEMAFGIRQEPQRWIPTIEEFAKVWATQREALAIMPVYAYAQLQAASAGSGQAASTGSGQGLEMEIIFEDAQHIVVKKPSSVITINPLSVGGKGVGEKGVP